MKINKTLAYALSCLKYIDSYGKNKWVEINDICSFYKLPNAYCNKVMQTLVHNNIIESRKGKGFRLMKNLDDVNVVELMEMFTYNGAPEVDDKNISVILYKNLRESVDKWLIGLSVKDIIDSVE